MEKKRNSRGKKKSSLLVLLLLLLTVTVGYALLSTTLNINGTTKIKNAKWDVHFDKESITPTTGSVTPTTAPDTTDDTNTTISYGVTLEKPGDFYEFKVDVVNEGTVVAKLESLPTLSGVSEEQDVYTNYTFSHDDDTPIAVDEEIAVGGSRTYVVRVEFDKDIENGDLPEEEQTLDLAVSMKFVQK